MKKYFYLIVLCSLAYSSNAQTSNQTSLFNHFSKNHAATLIQSWAHPTCKAVQYTINNYGHTYYLYVTYNYEGRRFTCSYKFVYSNIGELQSFSHYSCSNIWLSCFDLCDIGKEGIRYILKQEDNDKYVKMVGKALSKFTCEDVCFVRLYTEWRRLGYYNKY